MDDTLNSTNIDTYSDSSVFRTMEEVDIDPLDEGLPISKEEIVSEKDTKIEVPYLDYERAHGQPFSAEYFKLGDTWNDRDGGFPKEIGIIEEYIENKINRGDIANSTNAIKGLLRSIEKVTNVAHEERNLIKIETVAAYMEFLMKTDKIKRKLRNYGNH